VQLWRYKRPEFISFATELLSDLDVAALKPQKLVCSVQNGQHRTAAHIVTTMLDAAMSAPRVMKSPTPRSLSR
jgi:hypothetical protein